MLTLIKLDLEIEAGGQLFRGDLYGLPGNWTFHSEDPAFLAMLPSGTLHSYDQFDPLAGFAMEHRIYQALVRQVEELTRAKGGSLS